MIHQTLSLRKTINTLERSLDKVLALRGVSYDWKDTERFGTQTEIGFIAQEVELIVPEVVRSGGEYKSINTRNLIAIAVGGIQELYEIVMGMKEEIVSEMGRFGKVETDEVDAGKVKADKLCIEGICINGEQLKELLQDSGYSEDEVSDNDEEESGKNEDETQEEESEAATEDDSEDGSSSRSGDGGSSDENISPTEDEETIVEDEEIAAENTEEVNEDEESLETGEDDTLNSAPQEGSLDKDQSEEEPAHAVEEEQATEESEPIPEAQQSSETDLQA